MKNLCGEGRDINDDVTMTTEFSGLYILYANCSRFIEQDTYGI